MIDDSMFDEFKIEAGEMLDESEDFLLELEKGEEFDSRYNGIFRAFHSLKGAAGMFGLDDLQKHMHLLESLFEKTKDVGSIAHEQIDYFLRGVDEAKNFLAGNSINFAPIDEKSFLALACSNVETSTVLEIEHEYEYVDVAKEKEEQAFSEYIQKDSGEAIGGLSLKARIVIVDDEEAIVEILSEMMKECGHSIFPFTDGKKMLEELDEIAPDIILSDLNMPDLSGMELLEAAIEIIPDLPIIFISGFISKDIMLKGLEKGVYSYIEKPFNENQVVSVVRQAIIKYRTQRLLNKSLNYILYQYNNLDQFLLEQGKVSIRDAMRSELKHILEQKKLLKAITTNN